MLVLGAILRRQVRCRLDVPVPAPAKSLGVWGVEATACYLIGVLLVGVGFLLLYLDTARAILGKYGSFGKALGWPQAFGTSTADAPPPAVWQHRRDDHQHPGHRRRRRDPDDVARERARAELHGERVACEESIFFFGHVFINSTVTLAVISVYEILPAFTGRP